ncbi:hypothetical protein JG687_00018301 [Phytophthora cactorum]|uniref:Uncharacterized protein n=1 Tax=Phytophthora cactorum TaxID=29920 RepID=A0A8T1TL76_9STRA|nr:hypothetical protein JG687_00018301 [Phytophthora cactorum]
MLPANFEMLALLRANRDFWNATSLVGRLPSCHVVVDVVMLQYTDIGPVIIIVFH